jgi:hypothetical protein
MKYEVPRSANLNDRPSEPPHSDIMKECVVLDRRMWRQPLDLAYRLPVL